MKNLISALVLSAAMTFAVSGCAKPCSDLGAPTTQDKEAAANGYEVEREDGMGNECQLNHGGQWEQDD